MENICYVSDALTMQLTYAIRLVYELQLEFGFSKCGKRTTSGTQA
jgi:hypothetical protein